MLVSRLGSAVLRLGFSLTLALLCGLVLPCLAISQELPACILCDDDITPPNITITPSSGEFSDSTLQVTIEWCDDSNLSPVSREVKLNGERTEYAGHYDQFLQDPRGFVQRVCQAAAAREAQSGAEHCR